MNDKHFKVALILLTLPLSFGGGTTAGTTAKLNDTADANNSLSLKKSAMSSRGFRASDVAGRFGASPNGFADGVGRPSGTFVSSISAVETNCLSGTAVNRNAELDHPNADCFPSGNNLRTGNSAMGFPMYDSFNNSETSRYSRAAGSMGPLGPTGAFGGAVGSSVGPTSTPIATPEPGSFVLLAGGLLMLAGLASRRRQRNAV
jgi:hypothetical protein